MVANFNNSNSYRIDTNKFRKVGDPFFKPKTEVGHDKFIKEKLNEIKEVSEKIESNSNKKKRYIRLF